MARTPGAYGRRAPKRHRALQLSDYLTGAVPQVPPSEDYLAALNGGWQMLGNDTAGDCVAVTWANMRRLVTTALTDTPVYPTQDQVWQVYQTQNPGFDPNGGSATGPGSGNDNGMDIQTLLELLVSTGGPDGTKALAFASVNPHDPAEVKAAIALFGSVWTGINVLQANMDEFSAGQAWDYTNSPVDGGHSVLTGGYGPAGQGALSGDERFITWAQETSFTDNFWAHEVEECWVVIWPEHLGNREFLAGINMQQLAADYTAITGKPFPDVPVPPPAPVPPAPPSPPQPPAPPANVVEELIQKLEQFITWLKSLV